jgi:lipoprotein-anchoring transpeptidase ErfK/SrfK
MLPGVDDLSTELADPLERDVHARNGEIRERHAVAGTRSTRMEAEGGISSVRLPSLPFALDSALQLDVEEAVPEAASTDGVVRGKLHQAQEQAHAIKIVPPVTSRVDTIGRQELSLAVDPRIGKATATLFAERTRRAGLLGVAVLSMIASACQATSSSDKTPPAKSGASSDAPASQARVTITPGRGSKDADPSTGITVKASNGTLTKVTAEADGKPVEGTKSHGGTSWHSQWALSTNMRYTVQATATDASGVPVTKKSVFKTLEPSNTFNTTIFEGAGESYGVGMPIILTFSHPIIDKRAVERSLQVWTSKPVVGAWYWDGNQKLFFRPRDYWPTNTQVRFVGNLDGVDAGHGMYGVHTLTQHFSIGDSLIAVASTTDHHVKIYRNGKLAWNWPISTGKPGDDTPNGTYLTMDKANPEEMIGPGYDIQVPWSVRFTYSGDFMHDAFWSVGQQGFENVSHGCVNLSPANAETYYGMAVPGNPVTITGSPRAGVWGNGWTVWFLSWKELLRGSALHRAVKVNAGGSTFVKPSDVRPHPNPPPLHGSARGNFNAA